MNIFSIFTLLSLFYVYQAFRLGQAIWRDWANFKANPMTHLQKNRVNRAAFLIVVPPAVLLHELAHAVAIWLFGGEVVGGGFFFFWGFVSHRGVYTPFESWFISLAGTLGSLLVGIGVWLFYRRNASETLRYLGIRSLREQIILSLIYYPVFTAVSQIGDWRTIYDFSQTPFWSSLTAVVHAIILIGYGISERRGVFDRIAFRSKSEQQEFTQLQDAIKNNPNPAIQLQEISFLRERGLLRESQNKLKAFIQQYPNNGDAYLELALFQINKQQTAVPQVAFESLQKAVDLGISTDGKAIFAHRAIGQYHFDRGQFDSAIEHYNVSLKKIDLSRDNDAYSSQEQVNVMTLLYARSLAYAELSRFDKALQDVERAIQLALLRKDETAVKQYQETQSKMIAHVNSRSI